jgi:hypothetical protein
MGAVEVRQRADGRKLSLAKGDSVVGPLDGDLSKCPGAREDLIDRSGSGGLASQDPGASSGDEGDNDHRPDDDQHEALTHG